MTTPSPTVAEGRPLDESRSIAFSPAFWGTAALLGGLAAVLWGLHVEEQLGFRRLLPFVIGGFLVHAVLPMRLRLPFFVLLTMGAIGVILPFPWSIVTIGIALGLIGLCHLPIPFRARVGLVLLAGLGLAAARAGWVESWSPLGQIAVPVLGAIFMFRLVIYLFDMGTAEQPEQVSPWKRLGYFFLLPNVTFLLFPVLDWRTYVKTYYDAPEIEIYRKGVRWMARGALHLLIYRLVYYSALLSPSEVTDLSSGVEFCVSTYLLYLRISGQFHMIAGILCLFGFNVPETNHLYFLTTGFTDYWRRANIYWKDFMKKVFYFPAFTVFRGFGAPMVRAVWLGTVVVFVVTWLLHSYQWFWLQGVFPITLPDIVFWSVIGMAVLFNAVREARGRRRAAPSVARPTLRGSLVWASKVVGMYVVMAYLWGMWTTASMGEWFELNGRTLEDGAGPFGVLALALVALVLGLAAIENVWQRVEGWQLPSWKVSRGSLESRPAIFGWGAYASVIGLALVGVNAPTVRQWVGERPAEFLVKVTWTQYNSADLARENDTYYEGLLQPASYTRGFVTGYVPPPDDWEGMSESDAVQMVDNVLRYELKPDWSGEFKGARLTTNRWGMRDDDYERTKPPGTLRIALIGSSYVMGAGVANDETFGTYLEERLNREHAGGAYGSYEVLNFAVGGYGIVQDAATGTRKALAFEPDILLFPFHPVEVDRAMRQLARMVEAGGTIDDPFLQDVVRRAGVRTGMKYGVILPRLMPFSEEVARHALAELAEASRRAGAIPVATNMTSIQEVENPLFPEMRAVLQAAREAGFVVVEVQRPYGDRSFLELRINEWELHPTPEGHALYADALFRALSDAELFPDPRAAYPTTGAESAARAVPSTTTEVR